MKITQKLLNALMNKYDIQQIDRYGERGYSTDKQGILFANWNNIPKHVQRALKSDYELEWSDEWYLDYESNSCYRTKPDSYHWKPSVIFINGEAVTIDNVKDDPESYLANLTNDPSTCDIFDLLTKDTCSKYGYELKQDDLESGFYPQSTDDPKKILAELLKNDPNGEFVFGIIKNEQFRTNFAVFKKIDN